MYLFSGSIHNYAPQKLMDMQEYIDLVDNNPETGQPNFVLPDILQIMRSKHLCGYAKKTYEDLDLQ